MTKRERADYWQQQLNAWQASELSAPEFCKQQSLVYHQFVYWRQKMNKKADEGRSASGFAKVVPLPPTPRELTLSLPNGLSITGIHDGNVALLGAILRQL